MKKLVFCATGHRPNKLGGYTQRIKLKLLDIACHHIGEFTKPGDTIISGMALGWDTAIAQAAILLGRPLIAAIPFNGQHDIWPDDAKCIYEEILSYDGVTSYYVSGGGYSVEKMHKRDRWMVDQSDAIFSLWNGEPSGGTYYTLQYADRKGVREVEAWSYFTAWELL